MNKLVAIVTAQITAINTHDMDGLRRTLADDAIYHNYGSMEYGEHAIRGVDDWIKHITDFKASFSDLKGIDLSHITVKENEVITKLTWKGTHDGPLNLPSGVVIPPSNKEATLPALYHARIIDDKVVIAWSYFNWLDVMVQLQVL